MPPQRHVRSILAVISDACRRKMLQMSVERAEGFGTDCHSGWHNQYRHETLLEICFDYSCPEFLVDFEGVNLSNRFKISFSGRQSPAIRT